MYFRVENMFSFKNMVNAIALASLACTWLLLEWEYGSFLFSKGWIVV